MSVIIRWTINKRWSITEGDIAIAHKLRNIDGIIGNETGDLAPCKNIPNHRRVASIIADSSPPCTLLANIVYRDPFYIFAMPLEPPLDG